MVQIRITKLRLSDLNRIILQVKCLRSEQPSEECLETETKLQMSVQQRQISGYAIVLGMNFKSIQTILPRLIKNISRKLNF